MKVEGSYIKNWLAKAFNTSLLQKSRLPWVDYLKGIAILLVVYRHVVTSGIQLQRHHRAPGSGHRQHDLF